MLVGWTAADSTIAQPFVCPFLSAILTKIRVVEQETEKLAKENVVLDQYVANLASANR